MPKGRNQKLKLLYLAKILLQETDDAHGITMQGIVEKLAAYGVDAERKSLYDDVAQLQLFGLDIVDERRGRTVYYSIGSREFELPELKLLVDAVQSSRFITQKKSHELIQKLEGLVSRYEAGALQRQVYVQGRIKTMNESIYYNVDAIHQAMEQNCKIQFQYYSWNVDKTINLRHDGEFYHISPWQLCWNDENYYLIGYDDKAGILKHYRIDKMLNISIEEQPREGLRVYEQEDMSRYETRLFGMFNGEERMVQLKCHNSRAGVIIDRFGKDVSMRRLDEEHFQANVKVAVSGQFFGWIFGIGEGIWITAPEDVAVKMQDYARRILREYDGMSHIRTPEDNKNNAPDDVESSICRRSNLTTLCYMEDNNRYLMMHRVKKKNDINKDKWVGVGGHFEKNETPEECLLREVKEETGLTLTSWKLRGIITFLSDQWQTEYMYLYTADGFEGELSECDEGKLEWIDKSKVYDLPIWEGDKIFFQLLEQEEEFFSLKLRYIGETLVEVKLNGQEYADR